jgi:hypothetical protein
VSGMLGHCTCLPRLDKWKGKEQEQGMHPYQAAPQNRTRAPSNHATNVPREPSPGRRGKCVRSQHDIRHVPGSHCERCGGYFEIVIKRQGLPVRCLRSLVRPPHLPGSHAHPLHVGPRFATFIVDFKSYRALFLLFLSRQAGTFCGRRSFIQRLSSRQLHQWQHHRSTHLHTTVH